MMSVLPHTNTSVTNSCIRLSCSGQDVYYTDCRQEQHNLNSFSHTHWDSFPPISHQTHVFFGLLALFFGITAILGNLAVIWTFCRHRSLRSTANILIINLAVADLLMALLVVILHSVSALSGRWLFGRSGCMVYAASCALAAFVSISSMTVIALERHLVISQKYALTRILSKAKAIRWCIGTWVFSLVLSCSPFFGWGRYIPEGVETSCTFDFFSRDWNNLSFVLTISFVGFFVPLLTICVCYMGILIAITNHASEIRKTGIALCQNEHRRSTKLKGSKTDIRTAKIIFSTVTLFCLSWLPYCIIAFIGSFGNACLISRLVSAIPGMVAKASTMLNPLVYALCHERYKRNMKQLLRCRRHRSLMGQKSSQSDKFDSKDICGKIKTKLSFRSARSPNGSAIFQQSLVKNGHVANHVCRNV